MSPGETGTIEVEYDTSNRSGFTQKSITVQCNDPSNRRISLTVSANVDLQLECAPKRLWFGRLTHSAEPVTLTCTLKGSKIADVRIGNISLNSSRQADAFSWALKDNRDAGGPLGLDVTLNPAKMDTGKFMYLLTLETNLEQTPKIILNLSGDVSGVLTASPPRLLFGNYESGVTMEESVEITGPDGSPFRITAVVPGDPDLTVVFDPQVSAARHGILVKFNPRPDRERFEVQIRIVTDLTAESDLLIDVHGFQKRIPKKMTPRAVY